MTLNKKLEIVLKARNLGFESNIVFNNPYKHSNKEDLRWALWLNEIRIWLTFNHKMNINVKHRTHSQTYCYNITGAYQCGDSGELYSEFYTKFESYEDALAKAVYESLELIKT